MTSHPTLTDRSALARNRARALGSDTQAMFLHDIARDEVEDRLSMVNREFRSPAVVSGFPDRWQNLLPGTRSVADGEVLDLAANAHDLVVHALSLHWADDPVGQLIQSRQALRPDGLFLGLCFGGQTLHELRSSFASAEAQILGGISPRVLPMAEIRDLGALLQRAGFALPVADSHVIPVTYASALDLMRDLRAMGEANALAARLRQLTRRDVMFQTAATYAQQFGDAEARIPATFEIITLTGWAPDASQPQPLRPGSAAQRLADALGSPEIPLND